MNKNDKNYQKRNKKENIKDYQKKKKKKNN